MAAHALAQRRTWQATGTFPMWVAWMLITAGAIVVATGPLHTQWQHLVLQVRAEAVVLRARLLAPGNGARTALEHAAAALATH